MTTATIERTSIRALMKPLPKQEQALDALYTHKYILYGGAAGPGKSYWLRWAPLHFLTECAGKGLSHVRVGLFSEDYPTLVDRQISRIQREFPEWLGRVRRTETEGFAFHLHEAYGGGMIALRNLDDPSKYASTEFAAVFVEELTKNKRQTFDDLRFRLRWPGLEHTPFAAATNPGSIGHAWVKKLWVDRDFSGDDAMFNPDDFAFIRALPRDNPFLGSSYWSQLDTLPEAMRKALRDGLWDVFEGQAFAEWRAEYHVIDPFSIPEDWVHWVAIDYGYRAPFCALWFAKNPDGGPIYVYREVYATGMRASEQAQRVRMASRGERLSFVAADPSMWQQRERTTGPSLAEEYAKAADIYLAPANNNRIAGWDLVHEMLAWENDPNSVEELAREPGLRVFSTCSNLIRTLPVLPMDPVKVEDIDTDAEDHAADALRYGLMTERYGDWAEKFLRTGEVPKVKMTW